MNMKYLVLRKLLVISIPTLLFVFVSIKAFAWIEQVDIYGSLNDLKLDNDSCSNCGACLEVAGDRLEVRNNKVYFKPGTLVFDYEAEIGKRGARGRAVFKRLYILKVLSAGRSFGRRTGQPGRF